MFYLPAQTANSEFNFVFRPLVIIPFVEKIQFTTQQNVLVPFQSPGFFRGLYYSRIFYAPEAHIMYFTVFS
jgi:hypothetical protein